MFQGKKKAITFSYDDGVTQDVRLAELFHKYGLKATFNINSELLGKKGDLRPDGILVNHTKNNPEDIKHIYAGHEVAVHTLTHPNLTQIESDDEVVRQVEEDRLRLSELVGYEVIGMAYPCGGINCNDRVADLIRTRTGVKYSRTIGTTGLFDPYPDLFQYKGTVYHHGEWDKLFPLAEKFLSDDADGDRVFYIWGHAYEFDIYPERWEKFEEFCRLVSGHSDVFYGTNREVLLGE